MMIRVLMFAALLSSSHGNLLGTLLNALVRINLGTGSANLKIGSSRQTYLGCFTDDLDRLIDDKFKKEFYDLTHEWCFDFCREDNFRYAGLQFASECFCGNTIDIMNTTNTMNTTASTQRPESECDMACYGNDEQVCGGVNRMSLYELMY